MYVVHVCVCGRTCRRPGSPLRTSRGVYTPQASRYEKSTPVSSVEKSTQAQAEGERCRCALRKPTGAGDRGERGAVPNTAASTPKMVEKKKKTTSDTGKKVSWNRRGCVSWMCPVLRPMLINKRSLQMDNTVTCNTVDNSETTTGNNVPQLPVSRAAVVAPLPHVAVIHTHVQLRCHVCIW